MARKFSDTPRYVLPSSVLDGERSQSFEFPVQALTRTKPAASVVVTAYTFREALGLALSWATQFSTTQHLPVYPRVTYRNNRMMVKKISGPAEAHAYIENDSRGLWAPVAVLSV
jgi:hypothetical protein